MEVISIEDTKIIHKDAQDIKQIQGKQLGYFIIKESVDKNIEEEFLNLEKHYKQRFDIHSSNHPYHTYFTHIYIKKVMIGKFSTFGRVICMFLFTEYGFRYNKEDIDHMLMIIKKFFGRNVDFFTTEEETATFYGTTPIVFSEKQFHIETLTT